ncbi:MAG: XRE family transcriptional regulator [Firmicutes bacterium]|nr:XRE family transcriptional regulator [Bacillota bacterium]
MDNVGEYIKQLRKEKGFTQEQLGELLGVKKAAVQKWESGTVKNLKRDTIIKLAEIFGVSPSIFISRGGLTDLSADLGRGIYEIPVYENVSAGFGSYADSSINEYTVLNVKNPSDVPNLMGIKVKGDSMYPKIEDGDTIIVRRQTSVDSGSIAVVLIDGEEGVVKKVEYGKDWVDLISINPEYKTRRFSGKDVLRLQVVGLVKKVIKDI